MMKNLKPLSVVLAAMMLLTGCASAPSAESASSPASRIYQPRTLELQAGIPVQTRNGIYLPETNETWHSPAAYEQVNREAFNAAAALAQERARSAR